MEITSNEINVENGPLNRYNQAVATFNHRLWLYGGECTTTSRAFSDLWSYCPVKDEWREHKLKGVDRPGKLTGCVMTSSSSGIYLFGGVIFDQPGITPLWFISHPDPDSDEIQIEKVKTFGDGPCNMQHVSLLVDRHHGQEYLYLFGGFKSLVGPQKSFYRLNIDERRWEQLPTGPEARYKSGVCFYQGTFLVVGGCGAPQADFGDIWGFNTHVKQWTIWAKQLSRTLNGFCFVKNEILYIVGEARKSNYITINGYDLLERRLYSFYHKLPETVNFGTVMLGEREIERKRTSSAPNLCGVSHRKSPKPSSRNLITPTGLIGPAGHIEDEGVSLNEVRDQLQQISSVRYDATTKSVIFDKISTGKPGDRGDYTTSSFSRATSPYRSCRSDGDNSERRKTTPVTYYYNGPKCLLIVGGKPGKPIFKREPIKLFKVDL